MLEIKKTRQGSNSTGINETVKDEKAFNETTEIGFEVLPL
jgi:hypothetical protein